MNESLRYGPDSNAYYVIIGIAYVVYILMYVQMFLLCLIFPCFVYVFKMNRQRDSKTILFPILSNFYNVVIFFYILFTIAISTGLYVLYYDNDFGPSIYEEGNLKFTTILQPLFIICILISSTVLIILLFLTMTFQLLVSLLAISKFLIYFYPSTERYVVLTKYKIWACHLIWPFIEDIPEVVKLLTGFQTPFSTEDIMRLHSILLIATSLLYIPIMRHVRKFSYLQSSQKNKPEKYILYRAIIITAFRTVSFIVETTWSVLMAPISLPAQMPMVNYIATPLIIQISYLASNRRNVDLLFKSFNFAQFVKVILGVKTPSRVSPQVFAIDVTTQI